MAGKGPAFERKFATDLSLWWTGGARDDIFWRSTTSGARATIRGKGGKTTAGQCGDIAAIDPLGLPLLEVVSVELKKGYSSNTVAALFDKPARGKKQLYEAWFEQAESARAMSGALSWLLVTKRDRRDAICFCPNELLSSLAGAGAPELSRLDRVDIRLSFLAPACVVCIKYKDFFSTLRPETVLRLHAESRKGP